MPYALSGRHALLVRAVPAVVSALVAAVVLGPALGQGVVLAYDLAWSPDARLTPFTLGTSTPAPRAVPSDAAGVVLGWLVGAGVAQSLVLWGILVLAGVGAARLARVLAPGVGAAGASAAAVAAIWNPFVLERLVAGQWTVLLGFAAVPHLIVACLRVRRGEVPTWAPAVGLAACGVGGPTPSSSAHSRWPACSAVASPVVRPRARRGIHAGCLGRLGVPAVTAGVTSSTAGVAAFAARADTPLGVLGSLSSGARSGTRPRTRHPATCWSSPWVVAVGRGHRDRGGPRGASPAVARPPGARGARAAAGLAECARPLRDVDLPGRARAGRRVLRDAQKLLAPWVVLASAGAGLLVHALLGRRVVGPALAVLIAVLPVALLPSLAWGSAAASLR